MTWPVLRSSIDLLDAGGSCGELALHGGEPLLALPLVRRALAELDTRSLAADVSITTNGLLLDPHTVDLLARHCVNVTLSCDGVAAAQELRAPNTSTALDRRLQQLAKHQPAFLAAHVVASMTVTSANVAHLAAGVVYLLERGVPKITLQPLKTFDYGWGPRSLATLERQLDELAALAIETAGAGRAMPITNFAGHHPRLRGRSRQGASCNAARARNFVVDVDGSVYPCLRAVPSARRAADSVSAQRAALLRIGHVADVDLPARVDAYRGAASTFAWLHRASGAEAGAVLCRACAVQPECPLCPLSPAQRSSIAGRCAECDFARATDVRRRIVKTGLARQRHALRPPRLPARLRRLLADASTFARSGPRS